MKAKLSNEEIRKYLEIEVPLFPKYVTQILNMANRNAQGTRPKVVGQMSDLIQQFNGKSLTEWEAWYINKHPEAIRSATEKILQMIENFKAAMNKIDADMVKTWVEDLVIVKTFLGLRCQEAILKKCAAIKHCDWRLAEPGEESQGIDGFIGGIPVSIKPDTYKLQDALRENIKVPIIYYRKIDDGIEVDYSEIILG